MRIARILVVWLAIIAAETVHGTLRTLLLAPALGDFRARQLSTFTGALIILTVAYVSIDWIAATGRAALLGIGSIWTALTLAFEIALGRALGYPWDRILEDYDLSRGGLMLFGILFLALSPSIAHALRRKRREATA